MRRRDFIKVIAGSAATWPLAGHAQQPARMRRVSVLLGLPENDPETRARLRAFRLGMRDTGWVEGRNLQIEYRFAGTNLESIKQRIRSVRFSALLQRIKPPTYPRGDRTNAFRRLVGRPRPGTWAVQV